MKLNSIKHFLIPAVLLFLITAFTFQSLPMTFFQQDEWQYFGYNIIALSSKYPLLTIALPLQGQLTHFFPFATIFFFIEYQLFHVSFSPYAYVAIGLHLLNGILLFILVRRIARNSLIAFFSSALFLANSFSHQAVTWIAAGIGTFEAVAFMLIALMFFIRYLEQRRNVFLAFSLGSLLISLLFKEISLFLFVFLALSILIYFKQSLRKDFTFIRNSFILIFLTGAFYSFLRLGLLVFSSIRSPQPEVGDVSTATFGTYIMRLFFIPLKGIAQSFLPQKGLIGIADSIIHLSYPQFVGPDGFANPYISQSIVFDLVCLAISSILLISAYFIVRLLYRRKEATLAITFLGSILFLVTSFLPYIFIPGKAGYFSIFQPRDLYVATIASSVMTSVFFFVLSNIFLNKKRSTVLFMLPLIILIVYHVSVVRSDIRQLIEIGKIRITLLNTIKSDYPKLPKNVIVYTQSNQAYYGMAPEDKILPVQSGFGRMLLVWYQDSEHFPPCLYDNLFLHGITEQGYKYCDGRGFGYVRDYSTLQNLVKTNAIPGKDVISFAWNGEEQSFIDITKSIQGKLANEQK